MAGRISAVSFRMIADGRQIDLDRVGGQQKTAGTSPSIEQRIAALRSVVDRMPAPSIKGVIDLSLPAIVAGDTVVREVTAIVEPDERGSGAWRIRSFRSLFRETLLWRVRVGLAFAMISASAERCFWRRVSQPVLRPGWREAAVQHCAH
ncbi:MAG: hypothetical protein R3D29_14050 [Nitratireductor sp.]